MRALALFLGLLAAPALAQDAPTRPGDAEGLIAVSDSLAECASIAAVASSVSNSLIQRRNLVAAASDWFAASSDLAEAEGDLPEVEVWNAKVADWSARFGSIPALARHGDWMAYCAHLGAEHGLDASFFAEAG